MKSDFSPSRRTWNVIMTAVVWASVRLARWLAQRCSVENSMARLLQFSLSWMRSDR